MSTAIREEIRWHDRMEARVAAGILLLVTLSLAAVVLTATRVATQSAVGGVAYFNSGCWTEKPCHYLSIDDGEIVVRAYQTSLPVNEPVTQRVAVSV